MCHHDHDDHDHDDHKNTPPIHGRSILIYVTFWIHLCQILLKFQLPSPELFQNNDAMLKNKVTTPEGGILFSFSIHWCCDTYNWLGGEAGPISCNTVLDNDNQDVLILDNLIPNFFVMTYERANKKFHLWVWVFQECLDFELVSLKIQYVEKYYQWLMYFRNQIWYNNLKVKNFSINVILIRIKNQSACVDLLFIKLWVEIEEK